MQGYTDKPVRNDKNGRSAPSRVVGEVGIDADGRTRQKSHGSFRIREDAEVGLGEAR